MKKLLTSQCRADSTRCHCWKCSWSLTAALRRRNGWNSGAVAGEEETLTVGVGGLGGLGGVGGLGGLGGVGGLQYCIVNATIIRLRMKY
ncbi:hypothetical protein NC651_011627 [Populus alba x Populus x berolinensis]|nr:hypothetical protein NC651_011627 [Populus alba x Populus x berolinensis]